MPKGRGYSSGSGGSAKPYKNMSMNYNSKGLPSNPRSTQSSGARESNAGGHGGRDKFDSSGYQKRYPGK